MGFIEVHISPDGFKALLADAHRALTIALDETHRAYAMALEKNLEDSMNFDIDYATALDALDYYNASNPITYPDELRQCHDRAWTRQLSIGFLDVLKNCGWLAAIKFIDESPEGEAKNDQTQNAAMGVYVDYNRLLDERYHDAELALFEALTAMAMLDDLRHLSGTINYFDRALVDIIHAEPVPSAEPRPIDEPRLFTLDKQAIESQGLTFAGYTIVSWSNKLWFETYGFVPVWPSYNYAVKEGLDAARWQSERAWSYSKQTEPCITAVYVRYNYSGYDLSETAVELTQLDDASINLLKTGDQIEVNRGKTLKIRHIGPSGVHFDDNTLVSIAMMKAKAKRGDLALVRDIHYYDRQISQLIRAGNVAKQCDRYDVANACFVMAFAIATSNQGQRTEIVHEYAPYDMPWYDLIHVRNGKDSLCLPWPLFDLDLDRKLTDHEGRLVFDKWPKEWPKLVIEPRGQHQRSGVPHHLAAVVWQQYAQLTINILKNAQQLVTVEYATQFFAAYNNRDKTAFAGSIAFLLDHLYLAK